MQFGGTRIVSRAHYKMSESTGQAPCVVYGKDTNANYPILRLDYATLATGGTGFIVWWDGGFNNDSGKFYIVDIEMDPFAALARATAVSSVIVVTAAALDAINRRGDLGRLEAMQNAAFDRDNHPIGEASATFSVHGYVVWGYDTNLEIPGCVIDFAGRYECSYRPNTINANARQLLVAHNDDPIALLRAARRRHSYAIITHRAMTRMQAAGHDLSSIRESTAPSEKRGVSAVREASRVLRSGVGNVREARDTLSRYGFTESNLAEITMSRSTDSLIARIDRLCEISTGALVWASKHREAFPENKIGGSKGKYKARKVGQYGAKSLVNETSDGVPVVKVSGTTEDGAKFKGILHINTRMGDWVWAYRVGQRGSDAVKVKPDAITITRLRKNDVAAGLPAKYINGQFGLTEDSVSRRTDEAASDYARHAQTLLTDSTSAASDKDSRHATPWGLGYRTYLKTILRGDDPNNTKPKGEHLAGWTQARRDLASLDPMTEARRGPAKFKQSTRPGHSVRSTDVPRFMLARHINPDTVTADQHDEALNYLAQTKSPAQLRQHASIHYQQAKAFWEKGDREGALSQHWWGSMHAKAAGDSFIPASALFSSRVAESLPPGVKVIKHKSLNNGSTAHQVLVNGRSIGDFYAGRDDRGAFYTTHTDMNGRVVKAGEVLRDRDAMIRAMIAGDEAEAEKDFAKKKASPNRVEMRGDKVVGVYVNGKLVTDHGVKIDSKADIRRGAVFDLEDKYNAEFSIVSEGTLSEVAGYTMRASDKRAVDAWVQQKPLDGGWVTNDGTTLSTTGMGGAIAAKWVNGKPYVGTVYGNATQTLANYIRKALKSQGMTTIGKMDGKGTVLSENVYRTIHDAAIPDFAPGTSEVWFAKPGAGKASRSRLCETHVKVGSVKCASPERLFVLLQQHKWSPGGEARDMLESMGVKHQSLSVGDVLVVNNRHLLVSDRGFVRLEN